MATRRPWFLLGSYQFPFHLFLRCPIGPGHRISSDMALGAEISLVALGTGFWGAAGAGDLWEVPQQIA